MIKLKIKCKKVTEPHVPIHEQIEAAYEFGYKEGELGAIKDVLQEIDMFVVYGTFKQGGELRRVHNKIMDIAERYGIDMR
jgi:hypothetical protein